MTNSPGSGDHIDFAKNRVYPPLRLDLETLKGPEMETVEINMAPHTHLPVSTHQSQASHDSHRRQPEESALVRQRKASTARHLVWHLVVTSLSLADPWGGLW